MLFPSGNPFKCHEEVLYLQPLIPPKRFDIFSPPDWGMLRRSRCVLIFLQTGVAYSYPHGAIGVIECVYSLHLPIGPQLYTQYNILRGCQSGACFSGTRKIKSEATKRSNESIKNKEK